MSSSYIFVLMVSVAVLSLLSMADARVPSPTNWRRPGQTRVRWRGYHHYHPRPARRDPGRFDNFVTPRRETGQYEVTTEPSEDTRPSPTPGYLPLVKVRPRHRWTKKKPAGRVRIQSCKTGDYHEEMDSCMVFRGPNRKFGHHKYAQWGYYVVQPAGA